MNQNPDAPQPWLNGYDPRTMLAGQLAEVQCHIPEIERHLLHQRQIVSELERHGRGNSRTAHVARDILKSFEAAQSKHLNYRARLISALMKAN